MSGLPIHVHGLLGVGPYRQAPGRDPVPLLLPAGHERIELVTGGRGWIRRHAHEGGGWAEVTTGSIAWQHAGDLTIARSDHADPYRCLAISVAVAGGSRRCVPRLSRWDDAVGLRSFVRTALRFAGDPAADREALLAFLYGRLLLAAKQDTRTAPASTPLQQALVALERDYRSGIRLDALAREIGWSVAHLHDRFQAHLGISPHQWLMRRRLHAARQLLAATDQPIIEVADACGFSDAAALCRESVKFLEQRIQSVFVCDHDERKKFVVRRSLEHG
jgi:AraC-like DNA-binding protein